MLKAKSGSLIGKISCYLQIVANDPHSTAFVPLAEAFRQIGLLDDALAAARQGTEALPNFSPGFASLGRILGQMGQYDEAMAAYNRALTIDRQSLAAQVGLARLYLIRGERELARQTLQHAAEFHPEDEMLANMLLAFDLPRPWAVPGTVVPPAPAEALSEANAAGEVAQVAPIPTATLAEIYVKQGLTEQAIKVYEEILRLDPGNSGVLARLAALRVPAPVESGVKELGVPSVAPQVAREERSRPRKPLEVFEAWLEAIALRRAHVR